MDDMSEELLAYGEQLRETAMDLYREWLEKMRQDTRGRERLRLKGFGIMVPSLRALAVEYMLKGLALREQGS